MACSLNIHSLVVDAHSFFLLAIVHGFFLTLTLSFLLRFLLGPCALIECVKVYLSQYINLRSQFFLTLQREDFVFGAAFFLSRFRLFVLLTNLLGLTVLLSVTVRVVVHVVVVLTGMGVFLLVAFFFPRPVLFVFLFLIVSRHIHWRSLLLFLLGSGTVVVPCHRLSWFCRLLQLGLRCCHFFLLLEALGSNLIGGLGF